MLEYRGARINFFDHFQSDVQTTQDLHNPLKSREQQQSVTNHRLNAQSVSIFSFSSIDCARSVQQSLVQGTDRK